MYADRITGSMQRAMDETERRRTIQHAHNVKHGITPVGLNKKITDVMDVGDGDGARKTAEKLALYKVKSPQMLAEQIKTLEEQMLKHARDLEFEEAAACRDQVQQLQSQLDRL